MVLCSILPPQPEQVKWAYSLLPPPRFEVEKRYEYLKNSTQTRKAGVLHDPSPYANLQKDIAVKEAPDYSLEIPVVEQYKQDDADLSPQISKMNAAGAKALIKIGLGGSTLTAAKNIKQLGLDMRLLGSVDDLAVFKPAAEVLGEQFMFVAAPSQVYEALPDGALKQEIGRFLPLWRAKYGDRDPGWAGKAWDALMITAAAIEKTKSFEGPKVRDALETISSFQGTGGVYNFSPTVHQGITQNPFLLATIIGGKVQVKQ
jgi:branched-chain amino acid transport system substrate-binding protein